MLAIALERLEIVERHDAMRAEGIEQRHGHDEEARRARRQDGRAREPRQALVAERDEARPPPARPLEADRLDRIGPGREHAEDGGAEAPGAQHPAHGEREHGHEECDIEPPAPGDAPRGDRPVRLVHGIHMPVAPVVRGLAHAADQGACQHHPEEDQRPFLSGPDPHRDRAAEIGPDRREPGDGLDQLEQRARLGHGAGV